MNAGALRSPIGATVRMALAVSSLLAATSAFAQAVIHVAPNGDDRAPGSKARPVRSLERAQALVRAANAGGDVIVILADGTYSLDRPLRFGAADGGQRGHHVEWRAADGARPMLSGGLTVDGFRPYDEERRIWVADVPKESTRVSSGSTISLPSGRGSRSRRPTSHSTPPVSTSSILTLPMSPRSSGPTGWKSRRPDFSPIAIRR
ncbi:hypothetical protein PIB19_21855 [Sphingomonas sp. 7/4-4]|uniref:hypothetical protein n=1 Tax=Sphingomonas sp. 7/4-4 TaxID=3018446 RepID=UPI0022F3D39A|nr:hypothetical protein [Sphingomonas sp. 7/4-4]WBY07868.1 hypothetical protein PIB19_21855 [Sphingomonas sp. 7/4-4]